MPQNISGSEIRGKEFNKILSGYNKKEVEAFLEMLANQIESLERKIKAQQREIEDRDQKLDNIEEQKDLAQAHSHSCRKTQRRYVEKCR